MSGQTDTLSHSRKDLYNRLSAMHVVTLPHYASHFCGLPSTGRQTKHDLALWILQNSSPRMLNTILSFASARDVQDNSTRRKRVREPVDDESDRDAVRVRQEDELPNPSVFLEPLSDVEVKSLYRSFYESTSNARLRSGVWRVW
jgi:hypothetical protein